MIATEEQVIADYEKVFAAMEEFSSKYSFAENQQDINNWIVKYLVSKAPTPSIDAQEDGVIEN